MTRRLERPHLSLCRLKHRQPVSRPTRESNSKCSWETGLFTSESVSDGHPDKICDQISDAILDACLVQDPLSRVAIETAIKGQTLCLLGEITTAATIDLGAIAKGVLSDIGHSEGRWGLDLDRLSDRRGRDAAVLPRSRRASTANETGAGDQGTMFGFACDETPELMPLPISLAHALMREHRAVRHSSDGALLGPDAKAQVTVRYERGVPIGLDTIVLSTQHSPELALGNLRDLVRSSILGPVLGNLLTRRSGAHQSGWQLHQRRTSGRRRADRTQNHRRHLRGICPARRRGVFRQGRDEGRPLGCLRRSPAGARRGRSRLGKGMRGSSVLRNRRRCPGCHRL